MLRVLDIGFIWLSLAGSVAILIAYGTQGWYRNSVGRFIVALKIVVFGVYLRAAVVSIISPSLLRTDALDVGITGLLAAIITYGAYAFISTIRERQDDDDSHR